MMHLRITCDANDESGIGLVVDEISGPTRKHFVSKDYGDSLNGVVIVLMCRNPDLNFKRRLRFSKKDKKLYLDVMLDLKQMIQATHQDRKRAVINHLTDEVSKALRKYSMPNFDEMRFVDELRSWLKEIEIQKKD
jgi:hypothetical protein